jgi:vanillate O-demethylase monooxygenase subunit
MFLRNCWYVAATDEELGSSLMARTLLDRPVVMFRREDGAPVALEDRCSHRFLPLSEGYLVGDVIQCGYHGMEFDCTGACVHIPGQDSVPSGAHIQAFPVCEKWHFIWIWMGDPALADESLIPEIWRNDHPDWAVVVGEPLYMKGDYRLVADNLLDPSHVSFVHRSTLGTNVVAEIPQHASQDGTTVCVTRWILDSPPAPVYAKLGKFSGNVDRWQIMTFTPPSMVEVDMGSCVVDTGAQDGDRSQGIELRAYNLVTPETAESSFYFWTHVRNFSTDDSAVTDMVRSNFVETFAEDVAVIESVQDGLKRYADMETINIAVDAGAIRARRVIDELIAEETKAVAAE